MQAIVRHGAAVLLRCLRYFKGSVAKPCLAFTAAFLGLGMPGMVFF